MRLLHCACASSLTVPGAEEVTLSEVPSRSELSFLLDAASSALPHDPTPSLAEIQKSPSVAHLGAPQLAPQRPEERLRVVVSGSDAALSAVLTRLMRADAMWVEVAYLPSDPASPAAVAWGAGSVDLAVEGPVVPSPCIRTDTGVVVAGSATLSHGDGRSEYVGEIVVDSQQLVMRTGEEPSARFFGQFGARLVPTPDAPGLAASRLVTPLVVPEGRRVDPQRLEGLAGMPLGSLLTKGKTVAPALTDPATVLTGRALQSGGENITLVVDGVAHPRPLQRVTFYRHLRDIQSVRG